MSDLISLQSWIILFLVTMGFGPAHYIWEHLVHSPAKRDITLPPEDLSWRSDAQLYRSLAILSVLVAVGVFILTPFAENLAKSAAFVPTLLGAVGSYALGVTVTGWREGEIEPLVRGFSGVYRREDQPKRFWASMGLNATLGCLLVFGSLSATHKNFVPQCDDDSDQRQDLLAALDTCNGKLANKDMDNERRASLFAARGRVHHRLGDYRSAIADYSSALDRNPKDSYALYNRAVLHSAKSDLPRAIDDFSASLKLRPNNDEAYLGRGNAYLDMGKFEEAIDDFTALYERDRSHPYARANRGIAYAWMGDAKRAEHDFGHVSAADPGWAVVLRGRALLAKQKQDHRRVIEYLSQVLEIDSNDAFALHLRADAYWEIGELDRARDDDDRLMELERARASESFGLRKDS